MHIQSPFSPAPTYATGVLSDNINFTGTDHQFVQDSQNYAFVKGRFHIAEKPEETLSFDLVNIDAPNTSTYAQRFTVSGDIDITPWYSKTVSVMVEIVFNCPNTTGSYAGFDAGIDMTGAVNDGFAVLDFSCNGNIVAHNMLASESRTAPMSYAKITLPVMTKVRCLVQSEVRAIEKKFHFQFSSSILKYYMIPWPLMTLTVLATVTGRFRGKDLVIRYKDGGINLSECGWMFVDEVCKEED